MRNVTRAVCGTTLALIAGGLAVPHAAAADPTTCSVYGVWPDTLDVGTGPQEVRFGVAAGCGRRGSADWQLDGEAQPGSSGFSWLMLRNWDMPGGEKFTHAEDPGGRYTVDFTGSGFAKGNAWAGAHPVTASAFLDANGDGFAGFDEPVSTKQETVVVRRATSFSDPVVTPSRAFRGQTVTVSSQLWRADWDTGAYGSYRGRAVLQFRPQGGQWQDVRPVWFDGPTSTSVTASRPGDFRFTYAGDDVSGASQSDREKLRLS